MKQTTERILLFKAYERFWHWAQAVLIVFMALTGFEIHGNYTLFGFDQATEFHEVSAWSLVVLWVFTIFWHLTTGEYKHYLPTRKGLWEQLMYYSRGIFTGEPHPFHPSAAAKHNPLQRLTYLLLKILIFPTIWISGLLYLFYNEWSRLELISAELSLKSVALIHTAAAFLILTFLVAHLYLITTGETIGQFMKAMISGWEEVPVRQKRPNKTEKSS
ncbi:cytochrome b/b6 domain-containing protein [Gynuella sp.]|uniref:cytochrome b/b6 domain-containing protein n=1 Tax=Gynuella sp. TaxID=2969146 RepID=UPI003D0DD5C8